MTLARRITALEASTERDNPDPGTITIEREHHCNEGREPVGQPDPLGRHCETCGAALDWLVPNDSEEAIS